VGVNARRHILDGDGINGGHRPGTGIPGKTEFPSGWSDEKIILEIESIANDPTAPRSLRLDGRFVAEGTRDGVAIRVIIAADGRSIVTGHPTNLPRNPLPLYP
jgi:Bacterial EndoU nuclease